MQNCLSGNILPGTPVGEMKEFEVGPDGKKQAYYLSPANGGDKSKAIIM